MAVCIYLYREKRVIMQYVSFAPHPSLATYIDAYWMVTGNATVPVAERILPDGCVDIILNLGDDCNTDNNGFCMKNGKAYLVGTMTTFKDTVMSRETKLCGIRFKPAGFAAFYKYCSLHEVTDHTIEYDPKLAPDLLQTARHSMAYLDRFFLNRLSIPKHPLMAVINDIQTNNGQLRVNELSKRHFITGRQLERQFKFHTGVSPKEFINIVRFQSAVREIKNNFHGRSLLDIAFDLGYYDHAHLGNEIKKYTGVVPSLL